MSTSLTYVIKFVESMDKAVQFHVDKLTRRNLDAPPAWLLSLGECPRRRSVARCAGATVTLYR
jgi:hypothetical protein